MRADLQATYPMHLAKSLRCLCLAEVWTLMNFASKRNFATEPTANVEFNHQKNVSVWTMKWHQSSTSSKNSNKNAKPSARRKQNYALRLQHNLPAQTQSAPQRKKSCKFISPKRRKLKSKNTNFLFWRHSRNQTRNSPRSLKPCNSSSKSNKSP